MSLIETLDRATNGRKFDAFEESPEKLSARYKLRATRLTANIAANLNVPFFARNFLASGYRGILDVDAAVTSWTISGGVVGGVYANYEKLIITYSDGVGTDAVEITTSSAAPYPALLEATLSDVFRIDKMQLGTSAATLDQLNEEITVKKNSLFGRKDSNSLPIVKSTNQFQSNIVDIQAGVTFDKETLMSIPLIQTAGVYAEFVMDVTQIKKLNGNVLR